MGPATAAFAANPVPNTAPWDAHQTILAAHPPELRFAGGDVQSWQHQAREKLHDLLGLSRMPTADTAISSRTLWKRTTDLGTIEKIAFQTEPSQTALGYLCIPASATKPCPVFICLQGHSTGMHVSIASNYAEDGAMTVEGDRDFGLECMRRGIAAFCIEQRSFGNRREHSVGDIHQDYTCYQSAMNALMLGRTLLGERVFDVSRAIDFLATRPEVDLARLGCMGNSGGGSTTLFASAIDTRIQYVMPSCAFSTFVDSIMKLRHCACNYVPNLRRYFESGDIAGLIAPRPLVIVSGQQDMIFPIEPAKAEFAHTQKIYQHRNAGDQCQHIIGPEGHRFYAALAWPAMQTFMKHV